jgi:hypothetical protein
MRCEEDSDTCPWPLVIPSIGEECKTHFRVAPRTDLRSGVCLRDTSTFSSQAVFDHSVHVSCSHRIGRCESLPVLHREVGTTLPSGPLRASASFGTPQGHSLSEGPWTAVCVAAKENMDAHLRTGVDRVRGSGGPKRRADYTSACTGEFDSDFSLISRFGLYTSSSFHMRSTAAAILRATVSLARLGLVPASSSRR